MGRVALYLSGRIETNMDKNFPVICGFDTDEKNACPTQPPSFSIMQS
jgi:hypothetical protein